MNKPYAYIEDSSETLNCKYMANLPVKPILWAQSGRYGFISKEQVQNMVRRQIDLAKQQKGYAKDKPLDLVFHWDDTIALDPYTVGAMREIS